MFIIVKPLLSPNSENSVLFSGVTAEKSFDRLQFKVSEPLQRIDDVCTALGTKVYEVSDVKPLEKYLKEKDGNAKFAFKMTNDFPNHYRVFDTSSATLVDFHAPVNYSCTVLCAERVGSLTWLYILAPMVLVVILVVGEKALKSEVEKRRIEVSLFHI